MWRKKAWVLNWCKKMGRGKAGSAPNLEAAAFAHDQNPLHISGKGVGIFGVSTGAVHSQALG